MKIMYNTEVHYVHYYSWIDNVRKSILDMI